MRRKKEEIITLKVDETLTEAMRGLENRSEFIRNAIRMALDNICPLCAGSGTLSPDQQRHWEDFSRTHILNECNDCSAMHIVCASSDPVISGKNDGVVR